MHSLLAPNDDKESHGPDEKVLEPRVIIQPYGDHTDIWQKGLRAAHNLLAPNEEILVCVDAAVIHLVVVALGEDGDSRWITFFLMNVHQTMDNGDVSTLNLEDPM